jgi:hypothetical protein
LKNHRQDLSIQLGHLAVDERIVTIGDVENPWLNLIRASGALADERQPQFAWCVWITGCPRNAQLLDVLEDDVFPAVFAADFQSDRAHEPEFASRW